MKRNWVWVLLIASGALLLCICLAVAASITGGLLLFPWDKQSASSDPIVQNTPRVTQEVGSAPFSTPTQPVDTQTPGEIQPEITLVPSAVVPLPAGDSNETLQILKNEIVPVNDPLKLAEQLEGKLNIPAVVDGAPPAYANGEEKSFFLTNSVTDETFQVQTSLRYQTDHLYFWIENGVPYNQAALERLAETFENGIYPTTREYFGSEWTPGVDNDPHLYVVYARGLGGNVAGAYSSSDQYHPDARQYSNAHEMFRINADIVSLSGEYLYSTIAHEFQHMIHWYQDRNEEVWVSEGFSVLAQIINGYEVGGFDFVYAGNPDVQLNTWPNSDDTIPHYGAAFLFSAYFLDRYGPNAIMDVVSNPANGLDGYDQVLESNHVTDLATGEPVTADDLFADWVVTSYLNDESVEDGRYAYQLYQGGPRPVIEQTVNSCSNDWQEETVHQYGVDYIQINCRGDTILNFEGASQAGVLPEGPYSGEYAFWSNKGDESDMTLTRSFDLTSTSGPISLLYQTWYDIETDYDYVYLLASEDGQNWEILQTPSGSNEDPTGTSYGWGYTGKTSGWIEESVDLSRFAGKKIQLRFEYITDGAVNGEGLLIDDIRIPEIGYSEDFEAGDGGWTGEGFVRIQNELPQTFRIAVIREGETTTVEKLTLPAGQPAQIPLSIGDDIKNVILAVSGTTRYTIQPASYRFRFEK